MTVIQHKHITPMSASFFLFHFLLLSLSIKFLVSKTRSNHLLQRLPSITTYPTISLQKVDSNVLEQGSFVIKKKLTWTSKCHITMSAKCRTLCGKPIRKLLFRKSPKERNTVPIKRTPHINMVIV